MDLPLDRDLLCRRWVHAYEEDSATETVYRPADYALPRSRGRTGFEFNADGTFKRVGIGPTDVAAVKEGTWEIDGAQPDQIKVAAGGKEQRLKIQDLGPDRLALAKDA